MSEIDPVLKQKIMGQLGEKVEEINPFIKTHGDSDHFDAPSFLAVAVSLANALIFIHKTWSSVDWLADRVSKLASYVKGDSSIELNLRERIIAHLARDSAANGDGLSEAELETKLDLEVTQISETLNELENMELILKAPNGCWIFRAEDLSH